MFYQAERSKSETGITGRHLRHSLQSSDQAGHCCRCLQVSHPLNAICSGWWPPAPPELAPLNFKLIWGWSREGKSGLFIWIKTTKKICTINWLLDYCSKTRENSDGGQDQACSEVFCLWRGSCCSVLGVENKLRGAVRNLWHLNA